MIESLDAAKATYRLIKYAFHEKDAEQEEQEFSNVHILDLKTLTSVLTGEAYTFASACDIFGAPASRARKSRPRVTKPAIERLLRDVTGELELLNRLEHELEHHPLDLVPERCYSPATLAKGYFSAMGIEPPQEKFKISDRINGLAMQTLIAGRAESMIRRTPVPVTYVDFHAQFPAVSRLLNCREILCAESLEFADFTIGAREFVETRNPGRLSQPRPLEAASLVRSRRTSGRCCPFAREIWQESRFRPNFGMGFSHLKAAHLDHGSGRNRRKTDVRQARQNLGSHSGCSSRTAIGIKAGETA